MPSGRTPSSRSARKPRKRSSTKPSSKWLPIVGLRALAIVSVALVTGALIDNRSDDVAVAEPVFTMPPEPDPAAPVEAAFLGDSYTAGVGAATVESRWSAELSAAMGWTEADFATGSTGYVNPGDGRVGASPYLDRVPALVASAPDVVVVQGSVNDTEPGMPAALPDAAEQVFSSIRAGLPDATLVVVGSPLAPALDAAALRSNDATLRSVAEQASAQYVSLLDVMPAAATGLWDDDGEHPTQAGHDLIKEAVYQALAP
jgi:lysophospholipase L1-like esterase